MKSEYPALLESPKDGQPAQTRHKATLQYVDSTGKKHTQLDTCCFLCSTWWGAWQEAGLYDLDQSLPPGQLQPDAFRWEGCTVKICDVWCCPACILLTSGSRGVSLVNRHSVSCRARQNPKKALEKAQKKDTEAKEKERLVGIEAKKSEQEKQEKQRLQEQGAAAAASAKAATAVAAAAAIASAFKPCRCPSSSDGQFEHNTGCHIAPVRKSQRARKRKSRY